MRQFFRFLLPLAVLMFFFSSMTSIYADINVSGSIIDQFEQSVPDALIQFVTETDTTLVYQSVSDDSGLYELLIPTSHVFSDQKQQTNPSHPKLLQNYPNPFNPSTVIPVELPSAANAKVVIYNSNGEIVKILFDGYLLAGRTRLFWDGTNMTGAGVSAGIYIYTLSTENSISSRKMLLLDGTSGSYGQKSGSPITVKQPSIAKSASQIFSVKIQAEGYLSYQQKNLTIAGDTVIHFIIEKIIEHTIDAPDTIYGPSAGLINEVLTFSVDSLTCSKGHVIEYRFDWGDGSPLSAWDANEQSHAWADSGTYNIRVQARCADDTSITSGWSLSLIIQIQQLLTVTDFDGNVYQTTQIGSQIWTTENLRVSHYRNGDLIPQVENANSWTTLLAGARCLYDNDNDYTSTLGYLYNWHAVNDIRNIAPRGWHIATDQEWKDLEIHLGMSLADANKTALRGTTEGGKLKQTGTLKWNPPNTGATDEHDFSAIGGGERVDGAFINRRFKGSFWTSSATDADSAWIRTLNHGSAAIIRNPVQPSNGYSLRLIKNPAEEAELETLTIVPSELQILAGDTNQFVCFGTFSDLSQKNASNAAVWTLTPPEAGTITSSGFFVASDSYSGPGVVSAKYQNITGQSALLVTQPPEPPTIIYDVQVDTTYDFVTTVEYYTIDVSESFDAQDSPKNLEVEFREITYTRSMSLNCSEYKSGIKISGWLPISHTYQFTNTNSKGSSYVTDSVIILLKDSDGFVSQDTVVISGPVPPHNSIGISEVFLFESNYTGVENRLYANACCGRSHVHEYQYNWGDGAVDVWTDSRGRHIYQTPGTYQIYVKARCTQDLSLVTDWTFVGEVSVEDSEGTMTDQDGKEYKTVRIGDQIWMAENLSVTHFRNGDEIEWVTGDTAWTELNSAAYCFYSNEEEKRETYGNLYNWYAVNDLRGLGPEGWVVPTDEDFKVLERALGMSYAESNKTIWRGTDEGHKLKSDWGWHGGQNGSNSSKFNALPAGYRDSGAGFFNAKGYHTYFWTATADGTENAWLRFLYHSTMMVGRDDYGQKSGFSVRLKKATGFVNAQPANIMLPPVANSEATITVSSNTQWEVHEDKGWMSVSPTSGSFDGSIVVRALNDHTGSNNRAGYVTITGRDATSVSVMVRQESSY